MLRYTCYLIIALSISMLALSPTMAFANSDKPKCGTFECTSTGTHGGSSNTCDPGSPGCNTVTTTKSNPAGNNKTNTCTSPNKNVC
jgi:hypothetical protein